MVQSLRGLFAEQAWKCTFQKPNLSPFLERLGQEPHRTHLHQIFDAMIERLGLVVPDLGRNTAGDATYLNARRKKAKGDAKGQQDDSLPQASGDRKEHTDDEGNVTRVTPVLSAPNCRPLARNRDNAGSAIEAHPYRLSTFGWIFAPTAI